MRISDWSSDVCSSDLQRRRGLGRVERRLAQVGQRDRGRLAGAAAQGQHHCGGGRRIVADLALQLLIGVAVPGRRRSEEHTSELQSLMRISYAVFCLKKKKQT